MLTLNLSDLEYFGNELLRKIWQKLLQEDFVVVLNDLLACFDKFRVTPSSNALLNYALYLNYQWV